jgi:hypothetical protein
MKVSSSDIKQAFKEIDFNLEEGSRPDAFISRIKGNNAPSIVTFITLHENSEVVQFSSNISISIAPEKRAKALELMNLVHGKTLWGFRYWLDPDDGSVMTFGAYSTMSNQCSSKDLADIFMSCVIAADRIYPCLMAINFGDKSPEDAFNVFYSSKKTA